MDPHEETAHENDLLVSVSGGVARLTLNRPDLLNALSAAHIRQLTAALLDVGWRSDVGVVVLTGAGRAFSSGGDLSKLSKEVLVESTKYFVQALQAIRQCPRPVLAVVNGDAVAGGNELVIACDLAIASSSARLGHAGTRLGWAPILGATNVFTTQVGEKRAKEIVFLSKLVPAATALEWGWVNEVVDPSELEATEKHWCDELLARSPEGLQLAKSSANFWWDLAYASMASSMSMLHMGVTADAAAEGISAARERRPADWSRWR